MNPTNRRAFIAGTAALGVGALAQAHSMNNQHSTPPLVHHVFFWLKNPDSKKDRELLISGLRTLADIPTVRGIHIGVPASTEKREVVDNSFQVSEILYFENAKDQDAYQVHPIHNAFVEKYSHLWDKVIVYDAISV